MLPSRGRGVSDIAKLPLKPKHLPYHQKNVARKKKRVWICGTYMLCYKSITSPWWVYESLLKLGIPMDTPNVLYEKWMSLMEAFDHIVESGSQVCVCPWSKRTPTLGRWVNNSEKLGVDGDWNGITSDNLSSKALVDVTFGEFPLDFHDINTQLDQLDIIKSPKNWTTGPGKSA